MKKTTAILAALALTLFSVNAWAQAPQKDNQFLNHWSVGVGLLEDAHVQVAGTILPSLQVRVLYSTLSPYVAIADGITKNNPNVGGINPFRKTIPVNADLNGVKIDNLDLEAQLKSSELQLMLDFFPSQISNFHFTGGLIVDFTPNILTAKLTPETNGQPALKPAADGSGLVEFGGVSPDPNGDVNVWACYGTKKIRPYIGIGFGRAVDLEKRVHLTMDLGFAYIGGLHVFSEGYLQDWPNAKEVEITEEWCNNTKLPGGKTVTESVGARTVEYVGMANSFPVLPYARLTLNVRLF